MKPPDFWLRDGRLARALLPISHAVAWSTARRLSRPGWRAPVPVLCVGNVGVGGAGKTTVVLDLVTRLIARGIAVHCLTRGYGGRVRDPLRVDVDRHSARLVGDEPLLLAQRAPTWVGADRAASARLAVAAGAEALVMDDGLQNPGLEQDLAFLVIDGAVGFGNGRVIPAGPLREPVGCAAARCTAAVMIGADMLNAVAQLPPGLRVLNARLRPSRSLAGQRVYAFAGIARPGKFHDSLREAGASLAGCEDFPDHHRFRERELERVFAKAKGLQALVVTTPKDAARLDPKWRGLVEVVGVDLAWADQPAIETLLLSRVPGSIRSRAGSPQ